MNESMKSSSQLEGGITTPSDVKMNDKSDHLELLKEVILKKTEEYDPSLTGKESEFSKGDKITAGDLFFRYATFKDKIAIGFASVAAILFGAAMPAMMLMFGELSDSIGMQTSLNSGGFEKIKEQSMLMFYLAACVFFVSSFQMILFSIFAENISHRIRIMYFKACIGKDASWFDENIPS